MADIMRYRTRWAGWSGGPGISTFYAAGTDAAAFSVGVSDLFDDGIKSGAASLLGKNITVTFDPFVEIIDSATGDLISTTNVTAPGILTSVNTATSGACVTWLTAGVVAGKRVKGRTFFVPLNSTAYQDDGTLNESIKVQLQTACTAYANGAWDPAIYHRPSPGGGGGSSHPITAAVVRDKAAVLTSRRD